MAEKMIWVGKVYGFLKVKEYPDGRIEFSEPEPGEVQISPWSGRLVPTGPR